MSNEPELKEFRKPPEPIHVQDVRDWIAPFGPDVAVLITWTHEYPGYQFVTVGANRFFADGASRLRDLLERLLKQEGGPLAEDLRRQFNDPAFIRLRLDHETVLNRMAHDAGLTPERMLEQLIAERQLEVVREQQGQVKKWFKNGSEVLPPGGCTE